VSSQKLSEMLSDYLRELDEYCEDEQGDISKIEGMDRELAATLEGFTTPGLAAVTGVLQRYGKEHLEDSLDRYYVRKFLKDAAKLVQRTMQLNTLPTKSVPSATVSFYIREATRCFVYGFWAASVALSRAALELGLKETVARKSGASAMRFELSELVDAAGKLRLADAAILSLAEQVRTNGNRVVHARASSKDEAWSTLTAARAVLLAIYGGETPVVAEI